MSRLTVAHDQSVYDFTRIRYGFATLGVRF
jgi:hypothetical protein